MNLPKIEVDGNCLYLIQDLWGMDTYERAKALVDFCDKETKVFEKRIDRAIIDIFEKNGINIVSTNKSVLKKALDTLKSKGKDIEVIDLLENTRDYNIEHITNTKNHFTIMLEDKRYLQCGVCVMEKSLWNTLEQ